MAQGDLQKLIKALEVDVERFRPFADTLPHSFFVSKESIKAEVLKELAHKKINIKTKKKLPLVLDSLITTCYETILRKATGLEGVTITRDGDSATIYSDGVKLKFNQIRGTITKEARDSLAKGINDALTTESDIKVSDFLDIGHHVPVGDLQMGYELDKSWAAQLPEIKSQLLKIGGLKRIYSINSHFNTAGDKVFEVRVELEAAGPNRGKLEDREKSKILASIKQFVDSNDWFNQEASDSKVRQVAKTINNQASKIGFKVKPEKINTRSSKASKTVVKRPTSSILAVNPSVKSEKVTAVKPAKSTINLLALINKKLPEELRKRMTYPRLVYRTGRFADSVKAIAQNQLQNGTIVINYTYQKSPYQIFETTPPWATQARNPRTLISAAIRDIAKEAAGERFLTTRRV